MHFGSWFNSPPPKGNWVDRFLIPSLIGLLLVAITTALTAVVVNTIELGNVGVIYLLPVFVVAVRWGLIPSLICAVVSVGVSAFFFYPPIFSFKAQNWDNQVDLVLFTIVAVVTSHLASRLRRQDEIDRLREALIGSVSHELRTPLASILGAASVIANAPSVKSDPRLSTLANVVREEADRLNHDIQNLLDATRISSEGIRPKREWIDPADLVNVAIERRARTLGAHKVRVKIADGIPLFQGDPVLFDQAIGQVLSNAAKYSPPQSEITIDIGHENDQIVFSVVDHGAGMTPEDQTRWGDRFYRSERLVNTTTGSGLGIWIAKAFLEASGGSITAMSEGADRGTKVSIMMPVPTVPAPEAETTDE
jgi:two-component system sensor histidine kinase KdpD